jgi:hypothetical protein
MCTPSRVTGSSGARLTSSSLLYIRGLSCQQFARALDVYQGFNFRKDKQTNIGFINSLKIGTVTLAADIVAKDPMSPTTDVTVVAVMSDFVWGLRRHRRALHQRADLHPQQTVRRRSSCSAI